MATEKEIEDVTLKLSNLSPTRDKCNKSKPNNHSPRKRNKKNKRGDKTSASSTSTYAADDSKPSSPPRSPPRSRKKKMKKRSATTAAAAAADINTEAGAADIEAGAAAKPSTSNMTKAHAKNVLGEGPILVENSKYYVMNGSQKGVTLYCQHHKKDSNENDRACGGKIKLLFTDDKGGQQRFDKGGRLHESSLLRKKEADHAVWCEHNHLQNCQSFDFLLNTVTHFTNDDDDKIKRGDMPYGSTMEYYLERRGQSRKRATKKKGKREIVKAEWYNRELRAGTEVKAPRLFCSRDDATYHMNEKTNDGIRDHEIVKATTDVSYRLQSIALVADCPPSGRGRYGLEWIGYFSNPNSLFMKDCLSLSGMDKMDTNKIMNSLVPFIDLGAASHGYKTHNDDGRRVDSLYYNGDSVYGGSLDIIILDEVKDTKEPPIAYLDTEGSLAGIKKMSFLRVGGVMSEDEVKSAISLSEGISPEKHPCKMLPFILTVCCQFKYNSILSDYNTKKMTDEWNSWGDDFKASIDGMIKNYLIPFIAHLREAYVEQFDGDNISLTDFARFLWEEWPMLASRYDHCREPEDVAKFNNESDLSDEDKQKGLNFWYAAIIAMSTESKDATTKRIFNSISHGANTPLQFLAPLKEVELTEFIEVYIEILRDSSLQASRFHPVIEYAIVSLVLFDGDVGKMTSSEMRAIRQINWKKQAITQNVIASTMKGEEMKRFAAVGGDIHVNTFVEIIAIIAGVVDNKEDWVKAYNLYVLHHIGPEVGYFTNEVLAQYGQLKKGKTEGQVDMVKNIRRTMIKKEEINNAEKQKRNENTVQFYEKAFVAWN